MFEQTMRHLRRYQEIISVLIRNGFGFILFEQMASGRKGEVNLVQLGRQIRRAFGELGPTFMKIGQFASTRPDIVPQPVMRELEQLQDRAPLIHFEQVRRTIEQELGSPIERLFREFTPSPLAAASIGQVHYAVLHTGEAVVVKIQRPNIAAVIQTDLEIIKGVISLIEKRLPGAADYALPEVLSQFSRWLEKELDYTIEGNNAEQIAKGFGSDPQVIIPRIFWKFTTSCVLTMEYIDGVRLNDRQKIIDLNFDRKLIAAQISKALLQQILKDGFFHGDPHPGNIFVLSGGRIAFVDFGIVGKLTPAMKRSLANLISSMVRRNSKAMVKAIQQLGNVPQNVDLSRLRQDMDKLCRKYLDLPLGQNSLPDFLNEILNTAFNYRIEIPSDFILVGKSLITLEGLVQELDPATSLAELVKPFRHEFIKEQFWIYRWVEKIRLPKYGSINYD